MNVVFRSKSKSQNRFTITDSKFGKLFFDKGVFVTSDKEMVEALLNHPLKKRGEIKLESNDELVAKYLDGNEPDTLTKETLERITRQGIIELGKILKSSESQPRLIKAEIVGSPITDAVQEVLDFYIVDEEPEKIERKEEIKEPEAKEEISPEVEDSKPVKKKAGRPKKVKA